MGGTNDCTNTGQPCATIQNAINHSGPGDVIELGPGNYVENVTVDQNVTIQGDPTGSTVDGNQSGPVFFGGNAVTATLSRLTIRNGGSGDGGGIANFGTLTVTNTTISGNSVPPGRGGGILNDFGGTLTVTNSTISGNSSAVGGGIYNLATFTVTNSTISGNLATGGGGGLLNADVATLVNTTISGNTASIGGGLVNTGFATVNLTNTIIAGSLGGGDCSNASGTIGTNSHNLVQDGSCSPAVSGDPRLGLSKTTAALPSPRRSCRAVRRSMQGTTPSWALPCY